MNVRLFALASLLVLALAGCGASSGGSAALPAAPHTAAQMASAHVVITIPSGAKTASASRRPEYVSPFTQSITVQVDTGAPATQNLSPTSPNCTSAGANYPLNCTVPVSATAGAHTLTFVTYDQQNAAGNQLSANSIAVTFVTGQNPAIPVALDGVPAAVQILPFPGSSTIANSGALGSSAQFQFVWGVPVNLAVIASDADGNLIIGPGAPALSVTITGASTGSGIAVSPATNGNPNEFTLQSTGSGTATLSVTATPGSALAGAVVSSSVPLRATAMTTMLINTALLNTPTTTMYWQAPAGMAYDSANGNLYVYDAPACQMAQVVPVLGGAVTSIAGSACPSPYNYADGTGAAAQISYSLGANVAYDSADGNLYIVDQNNCAVRRVTPAGVVTTIAGGPPPTPVCGFADGTGSAAMFSYPTGIAYDSKNGDLYVFDNNCAIRQVTTAGVVTTIAGSTPPTPTCGYLDGTGSAASFGPTVGIAYDSALDALFVTDNNNCAVREVTPAGVVTTIAGSYPAKACGLVDGTGTAAKFGIGWDGIAYDSADGNLYVSDPGNCAVRQVTPAGVVFTIAGSTRQYFCLGTDGIGSMASIGNNVGGIVYDPATGYLYIDDYSFNHPVNAIREIQL